MCFAFRNQMVCVLTARRLARDQKAIEQHMNGILYKTVYMKCKFLGTSTLVGLLAFVFCVQSYFCIRYFTAAYRWSRIKAGYLHI